MKHRTGDSQRSGKQGGERRHENRGRQHRHQGKLGITCRAWLPMLIKKEAGQITVPQSGQRPGNQEPDDQKDDTPRKKREHHERAPQNPVTLREEHKDGTQSDLRSRVR